MSKLLFDTQPLVIDPCLAKVIGLNEAIILQQIHYWIEINRKTKKNIKDGHVWTYNSLSKWQEQFPFWSESTVKRTITQLKKKGLIVTGKYNKTKMDRTTWYRIDYEELETLVKPKSLRSGQNDPLDQVKMNQSNSSIWDIR